MSEQKNLLIILGEWWEQRQRQQPTQRIHHWRLWLPSRGNVLFTTFMISLLLWAQNAGAIQLAAPSAASTGTIAYQGRLASAGGAPLTQTIGMEFRLYAAATGGAPLWTEQWTGSNSVQVSDGLFNVMLGSLTSIPQSVIAGNSNLFLGITVGTDDEMSPRVQLGSVPFAVQALTVPDGSVTTGKIADGAVTQVKLGDDVSLIPPDDSITTAKIADAAVTQNKAPFAPVTYWGIDSTPDPNMKSAIVTSVFVHAGANSLDIDIAPLGFKSRPLGICQIADTPAAVSSFICSYSWDGSSNTTAHIWLYPQDGTGSGPFEAVRITLFLMGF